MHTSLPDFQMPNDEQVHLAAEGFRLLADPTRIKILWALLQGESSVACLAELVGAAPTAVSQHLAKLRLAGLVRGRREGTFVHYSAADTHVRALLAEALFHADHTDRNLPDHGMAETAHTHLPHPPARSAGQHELAAPATGG
ncbi:ArsR/SmtB family transcription factor [Dactylosporangium sucinum]|uniref:ArsR/SmtB family transcription factor n=1 Tax=Dactylosporangium sucinum TaxID=1424081 RepID=UPI001E5666A9|nr:metalloregulator ArsR/SmtB family transcription factor [Dactylosporangium sucinum]